MSTGLTHYRIPNDIGGKGACRTGAAAPLALPMPVWRYQMFGGCNSIRVGWRLALLSALALGTLAIFSSSANAGSYIVAQCSPGVYPGALDAGFTASTSHYSPHADCGPEAPGMQITHFLTAGETGTVQGAFGAWVWQAPAGTFITGGSTFSRLATEAGQHGYLAVSPDSGSGVAFENQNDNQGHEAGIPAGNWRYLVARLECTQPNEGNRCVGAAAGAHTFIKQVRIVLTDVSQPTISTGGSMFSGGVLRGPQAIAVSAADQGAGLASVAISVNGKSAAGDDLSASCNPLPGDLTSRMSPCPPSFGKTYALDTAAPPFQEGTNTVTVCAADYARIGTPNSACETHEVLIDNLCPGSPVGGGQTVTGAFAGNGKIERTLAFHRRALIHGRLRDGAGNPIAGAQVCIQGHSALSGRAFHLIGTATTNQNGGWAFKLHHGPSRTIRVGYRFGAFQTSVDLELHMRAKATLHLSCHRARVNRKVYFSGEIAGPRAKKRVVVVRGTVPGAKRLFLVRRARTDALGHFRVGYAFSPVSVSTRFVFWAVVPEQNGYPYVRGRSVNRFIRVRP